MKYIIFFCWCWYTVSIIQPSYRPVSELAAIFAFIGLSAAMIEFYGKGKE